MAGTGDGHMFGDQYGPEPGVTIPFESQEPQLNLGVQPQSCTQPSTKEQHGQPEELTSAVVDSGEHDQETGHSSGCESDLPSRMLSEGVLSYPESSDVPKKGNGICCYLSVCVMILLGVIFLASLIAFLVLFFSLPNQSAKSVQTVLQGDTVPLYFLDKADLLATSYDTSSYESVNVSANPNQLLPIKVLFVNGDAACTPSANDTRHHTSADIPLSPDAEPVFVIKNMFFAPDSIFTANFSIVNTNNNTGAVTLDIFDNKKSYEQCLVSDELHSTSVCRAFKKFSFPIVDGMTKTINYTFPEASYYFMLLSASATVTVQYTYKLSYKYYRLADYTPTSSCTIEDDDPKPCLMKLNSTTGCLFVNSPSPDVGPPSFTDMNVTVTYKQKTLQNGSLLAPLVCGILAVAVFVVFAVPFTVCCCRKFSKKRDIPRTTSRSNLLNSSEN